MKRLVGQWSAEEGVDLRIWDWGGLLGFEMTGGSWFIPKPEDLRDILAVIATQHESQSANCPNTTKGDRILPPFDVA